MIFGHTDVIPNRTHVNMYDYADLPIPVLHPDQLDAPPVGVRQIAALRYAECMSVSNLRSADFIWAQHVAYHYATRAREDSVDVFVRCFWHMLNKEARIVFRRCCPIPCSRKCQNLLKRLWNNTKFTLIDNPYDVSFPTAADTTMEQTDVMTDEQYQRTRVVTAMISLLLSLLVTFFFRNLITSLISSVKHFLKDAWKESGTKANDIPLCDTESSPYQVKPSSAPVRTVKENAYPNFRPGNAPLKTVKESWFSYFSKAQKGEIPELMVQMETPPPELVVKVEGEGLFTPVRQFFLKTKSPVDESSVEVQPDVFFSPMIGKKIDETNPEMSGLSFMHLLGGLAKGTPDGDPDVPAPPCWGFNARDDEEVEKWRKNVSTSDIQKWKDFYDGKGVNTDAYLKAHNFINQEASPSGAVPKLPVIEPQQVKTGNATDFQNPPPAIIESIRRTFGQAMVDENCVHLQAKLLYGSMYKLEIPTVDGDWRHLLNIIFIRGRLALTNRHTLYVLRSKEFIRIRNPSCQEGVVVATKDINYAILDNSLVDSAYRYRDCAIISFPRSIRQHADIVKHFMTGEDFQRFTDLRKAVLVGFPPERDITGRTYITENVRSSDRILDMSESVGVQGRTELIRDHFEYNIETRPGECGYVLLSMNPQHIRKIVGIHCSGQPDTNYQGNATPVSQEMIEALMMAILKTEIVMDAVIALPDDPLLKPTKVQCFPVPDSRCESYLVTMESLGSHFCTLGRIKDPIFGGTKSSIVPSPIGEMIVKNKRAPAKLCPFINAEGAYVDPMRLAMKKADVAPSYIDSEILDACVQDVARMLRTPTERSFKPLTLEEAICGIDGDPWITSLARRSSPGYPWIHQRFRGRGKEQWLGQNEKWILDDIEFTMAYNRRMVKALFGERIPTYWVDTLKDELRDLSRVAAGKTRLFSVGEMTFNVAIRQYFLPVVAHIMENRIRFESCVGVNVYSTDWEKIVKKLMQKGTSIIGGDFSGFDGALLAVLLWAVCDILSGMMDLTPQEKIAVYVLFSEIAHSVHINRDKVYTWNQSQPSGNPLTVIINSLIVSLLIRIVWMIITVNTVYYGMAQFNKHVSLVDYGDDVDINVTLEALDFFNGFSIAEAFATIGFTFTDEHKGVAVRCKTLATTSFLKREFVFDDETFRWKAPLSLDTVLEMAQWVRGKEDHHSVCAQTLEMAVYELAQHTRTTFNKYIGWFELAAKVLQGSAKVVYETYDTYQKMDCTKYFLVPKF